MLSAKQSLQEAEIENESKLFVNLEIGVYPLPPGEGYLTTPQLTDIPYSELHRVRDFAIWNQFGCIEFFGETDLTGADLAKDIVISNGSFDIYEGRAMP